ncbi:MAG: aldo/keto reductase [Deltaproteobacteria bacterium]|jgi:predicted aldo/keto reductase-like oxidoreductase|nr:aldo/keto reductase [Deltaproteobacteria bacterium]
MQLKLIMKKLGFGFMRLPVFDEKDRSTVDIEAVKIMVDRFMERGFACFDTARRHNDKAGEPTIRKAPVKRYPRDSYILTDKMTLNYISSAEQQEPFIKEQLSIGRVDYFDNYLPHNTGAVWHPLAEKYGAFDFMLRMRDSGHVRHIWLSFHGTADELEVILKARPEAEIVQLQINYLDWEDENIQSRRCYEVARKFGKHIVVMEPVKGGTLTTLPEEASDRPSQANQQASPSSRAIRHAAGLEGVTTVLSGMTTLEQVEDNTGHMQDFQPLTSSEQDLLKQVAELIRSKTAVACAGCRYCTTECPKNIAVPEYFSLYNNMKRIKNTSHVANQLVYYANIAQSDGKASDCVECGSCEKNCPRNLPIREYLVKIASEME